MDDSGRRYYIKLKNDGLIEVSKEVYTTYYKMQREEKYQQERDLKNGLLHYDSWDSDRANGSDCIRDTAASIEERVNEKLMLETLVEYIEQHDKHKILSLVAAGKKEDEIAAIIGISQSGVNKKKRRLLRKLAKIWKENF